jgi:uncharacterized membrane protein
MRPTGRKLPGAGAKAPALDVPPPRRDDPPRYQVTLWPHRSLSLRGFRGVLIITAIGLAIPLFPFLGTPVGWGLLPFLLAALIALYASIKASYRSGRLTEVLCIWDDLITLTRTDPKGRRQCWHANPFWVTVHLHKNAKIENYLTLKGNGREVELGAFLSPEERESLYEEVLKALRPQGS